MKARSNFNYYQRFLQSVVVGALVLLSTSVLAAGKTPKIDATGTPHEVVASVTDQLLIYLKDNSGRLESDAKGYYSDVRDLLEPVIAFNYIAKNVMGEQFWKAATDDQKKKFTDVFTDSLVETYVKGMANYAQFEVTVVPPTDASKVPNRGKVSVTQMVKNAQGNTKVAYTLARKEPKDNWQLINVSLGSSNLGKSLRSQFAGAVSTNLPQLKDGEKYSLEQIQQAINLAIDNWGKA